MGIVLVIFGVIPSAMPASDVVVNYTGLKKSQPADSRTLMLSYRHTPSNAYFKMDN